MFTSLFVGDNSSSPVWSTQNIQVPAKSIADKRMCKAASKIGTDFDFLFSVFF